MTSGTDFLSHLLGYVSDNRTTDLDQISSDWVGQYLSDHNLSPEYLLPILEASGDLMVPSCAGSGKTTALSVKVLSDLSRDKPGEGKDVWVGTFLRTGSSDLVSRINEVASESPLSDFALSRVKVSTVHAEFLKVASSLMSSVPEIISESYDAKLLHRVFKEYGVPESLWGKSQLFLEQYANSLGVVPENPSSNFDLVSCAGEMLSKWKGYRFAEGYMNHNDVQDYLIHRIKTDVDVPQYLSQRYSRIYVDEFQDVSRAQYFILNSYLLRDTVCVCVGDDDQTIYSWRGSDANIITNEFIEDHSPSVLPLPINHRCPANILEPVIPSIEKNDPRLEKNISSSKPGGELQVVYGDMNRLLAELSEGIQRDLESKHSIAVLVRTNADGFLPALLAASLPNCTFRVSKGMALPRAISQATMGFFDIFQPSPGSMPDGRRAIGEFFSTLFRVSKSSIEPLITLCDTQGVSVFEALMTSPLEDIEYSMPRALDLVVDLRHRVASAEGAPATPDSGDDSSYDSPDHIEAFLDSVNTVALSNTPKRMQVLSAINYLNRFSHHTNGVNTPRMCRQRAHNLLQQIYSSMSIGKPFVNVSTVHDFKGKEADSVYIWNDTEGIFPHSNSYSALEVQEERRLHYIACTRAKKKLTILAYDKKPSRFIEEMDLSNVSVPKFAGGKLGSKKVPLPPVAPEPLNFTL